MDHIVLFTIDAQGGKDIPRLAHKGDIRGVQEVNLTSPLGVVSKRAIIYWNGTVDYTNETVLQVYERLAKIQI